jgi:hypothetical protein
VINQVSSRRRGGGKLGGLGCSCLGKKRKGEGWRTRAGWS